MAKELRKVGLSYVGVSLDGLREVHDRFRGKKGAFKDAMQGIRNCQEQRLKVGLRFTLNRMNVEEVPGVFDLLEEAEIPRGLLLSPRVCGTRVGTRRTRSESCRTRKVVDLIIDRTRDLHRRGLAKEVLTVDNHADVPMCICAWCERRVIEPEMFLSS